jgi:hypothetical protein
MIDDQHQPAAAAPGLSEEREAEIRRLTDVWFTMLSVNKTTSGPAMLSDLLAELDATRADLARTRAERDALKTQIGAIRLLYVTPPISGPDSLGLCHICGSAWLDGEPESHTDTCPLAASQSEQPPVAPVAPSAETFGLQQCCRNWAWTPEMGPYAGIHHPWCWTLHAITPPDHQAGDEP